MPTYHFVQNQGKLMMQSRENGQKPQFGQFFGDFKAKYQQIFWKIGFIQIEGQKPKKSLQSFLKKISKCLILGYFCDCLQIKNFFQKSGSATFLPS